MAVVLSILKIIGIVLLIVLLILLAVIACVLFIPIRYQGSGDIEEKRYQARLSWLLGLLQFRVRYDGQEKLQYGIYIFARRTGILDPERMERRKQKKKDRQGRKKQKAIAKFHKKLKKQKAKIHLDPGSDGKQQSGQQKIQSRQEPASKEQERPKSSSGDTKTAADHGDFEEKTEHTLSNVWKTCKKVLEILRVIREKDLIGLLLPKVKRLLYHIRPRKIKADLTFGFSDPSVTGKVLGAVSWLFFLYQYEEFVLTPDFETEQTYIRGDFLAAGHIRGIHLLIFAIGILKEKEFRAFIKSF